MPEYILFQRPGDKTWQRVPETEPPNEAMLQEIVKAHPETLPLEDVGGRQMLIVGRESWLGNGAADVVGIDADGLVTIIECKLDRNPEVKRKVVGQVLGYGAYLWGMTYEEFETRVVRPYFGNASQCHDPKLASLSLAEAVETSFAQPEDDGWSQEEFRRRVEANLARGNMRLVIVVDKVNEELSRTVEFLNACTGPSFHFVCAELRYFATETAQLLVPTLVGAAKPRLSSATPHTNEETFLAAVGDSLAGVYSAVLAEGRKHKHIIYWGEKGYSMRAPIGEGGKLVSYLTGWPGGSLDLLLGNLPMAEERTDALSTELRHACPQLVEKNFHRLHIDVRDAPDATLAATHRLVEAVCDLEARSRLTGDAAANGPSADISVNKPPK